MQWAEILDKDGIEHAHLNTMFIIHEHGRIGLTAGGIDFGFDAETFTNDNGRGNHRITDGGKVMGFGPLWYC